MYANVGAVSGVLLGASLLSKVASDPSPRSLLTSHAGSLVARARTHVAFADEATSPVGRLENLVRASALLEAARGLASDADVEAEVGTSVPRLLARLERRSAEARGQIAGGGQVARRPSGDGGQ
jgi:hypothetical protein